MEKLSSSKVQALKDLINAELKRRANPVGPGSVADKKVEYIVPPKSLDPILSQQGTSLI